jgi:type I restriction enzyme S subunit
METANAWPLVSLGEGLTRSEERVEIRPDREYLQVTVRLWGSGVILRNEVSGTKIAAKKRYVVRPQQFLLSRIDARNGAFGLVPDSLDGAGVSNDFPTFNINRKLLEPRFLEWMSKTKKFVGLCRAASEGTTNRVRLQVDRFLVTEISLPPLEEQRRIVARIEELAAKVKAARALRQQAVEETGTLVKSASGQVFARHYENEQDAKLGSVTERITKGESPGWQGFNYVDNGPLFIRSENVLWGKLSLGSEKRIPWAFHEKLSRSQLCSGDVLINLVGASIGRTTVVPDSFETANINQAVAVITPTEILDSRYLMLYLLGPVAQKTLHAGKVETARPNISLTDLRNLCLPVPPLSDQRRIVAYLDNLQAKIEAVKQHQVATAAALDALLPSILDRAFKGEL